MMAPIIPPAGGGGSLNLEIPVYSTYEAFLRSTTTEPLGKLVRCPVREGGGVRIKIYRSHLYEDSHTKWGREAGGGGRGGVAA